MSPPASRLGRGLASLIPDGAFDLDDEGGSAAQLIMVPLDEVVPNPEQPRASFDPEALEELSDSIREHGVLSPLVCRRDAGRYVLIAGERRLRASGLAGLTEVPVVVRNDEVAPKEQLELALIENLQRADLDAVEAARGYERLMTVYHLTQEQVARRVGKKRSTVANALRLLKLPEVALNALQGGQISAGHARTLVPLSDAPHDLRQVLAKVIAQQLNVRATERLVSSVVKTPAPVRAVAREKKAQTYDYAQKILAQSLRTDVQIQPKRNGAGRIVIGYAGHEELERLISLLRDAE